MKSKESLEVNQIPTRKGEVSSLRKTFSYTQANRGSEFARANKVKFYARLPMENSTFS